MDMPGGAEILVQDAVATWEQLLDARSQPCARRVQRLGQSPSTSLCSPIVRNRET